MSGIYAPLLQGKSHEYWMEILKNLSKIQGNFTWNEVQKKFKLSKSELSRLKCSGFIVKNKGKDKVVHWKLHPSAVELVRKKKTKLKR